MTPFKIGSIYRQNDGLLVQLEALERDIIKGRRIATTKRLNGPGYNGCRFLDNGRYCYGESDHETALQAGELNAQGEPIAPTFYCAAETIKPAIDWGELSTANLGRINAMLREVEAQVVVREEFDLPDSWSRIGYDLAAGAIVVSTNKPVAEKVRPPLEWARSKAPDRFPGYSILRDTATPDHAYSHPLTRVADAGAQVNPASGSAWLVVR